MQVLLRLEMSQLSVVTLEILVHLEMVEHQEQRERAELEGTVLLVLLEVQAGLVAWLV
jgi:hypothetical protein